MQPTNDGGGADDATAREPATARQRSLLSSIDLSVLVGNQRHSLNDRYGAL